MTQAITKKSAHTPTKRLNKRQMDFINNWVSFTSDTFGNTYQSAIKAGFRPYSAKVLTSNSHNIEWVQEAKKYMDSFTPEHITSAIQHLAHHAKQERDQLQALSLLTKIKGMQEGNKTEVNISFTNTVPRPAPTITPIIEGETAEQG